MTIKPNITSTTHIERTTSARSVPSRKDAGSENFASVLGRETAKQDTGLKISSHAQKRLDLSKISFSEEDKVRINGALERASEKGSNQALIMLDDLALVVSVKNKVVITAVDEARNKEGIFTNIDSVVIA